MVHACRLSELAGKFWRLFLLILHDLLLQDIVSMKGKASAFAVTGTHAMGVALQRALGA